MAPEERIKVIGKLIDSFEMLPRWQKHHVMNIKGLPVRHPTTQCYLDTFRDKLKYAADECLLAIADYLRLNGDLVP